MVDTPEQFHVTKRQVPVRVRLASGTQISAALHCAEYADSHLGRERVKDVLNAASELVPLWNEIAQTSTLVNKRFIELVELIEPDLALSTGADFTERRQVMVVLSSGTSLRGALLISTPPGQDRTLDFLNRGQPFFYLETEHGTRIVHLDHVVTVTDVLNG